MLFKGLAISDVKSPVSGKAYPQRRKQVQHKRSRIFKSKQVLDNKFTYDRLYLNRSLTFIFIFVVITGDKSPNGTVRNLKNPEQGSDSEDNALERQITGIDNGNLSFILIV